MGNIIVTYRFEDDAGARSAFRVVIDEETLTLVQDEADAPPDWAALAVNQCPHCPLDPAEHRHCPAAAALGPLLTFANRFRSYDRLKVEVETEKRRITAQDQAQILFGSLIGLTTATSGCPYTAYFKPMARFHLPFASMDETIYRVFAMYLLAQYFLHKDGHEADFRLNGLKAIYENIETVNLHLTARLRLASETDSGLNAVIVLDTFAKTMLALIDEQIEEIRPLFAPFLDSPTA